MPRISTQAFERAVQAEFRFLTDEYSFSLPSFRSKAEEYRDRIIYLSDRSAVELLNAWHPSDYGFEVNYYPDKARLQAARGDLAAREMVYYRLKEEQDPQAQFIKDGAKALRRYLHERKKGLTPVAGDRDKPHA